MSNFDKLKKTVEQLKLVTAGRHPQSPGQATKPAADPGKPKNTPHIRADSQTEVNFKLEKAEDVDTSGKNPKLKRALVDRMVDNNWKPYFRWLTHPHQYSSNGKFATEEDAIAAIPPHVTEIIVQYRDNNGNEVNKKINKSASLQKSDNDPEGQFFVDFPEYSNKKTKAKGGWATWHFTKRELADILRNWDTAAHWEWRGNFPRAVAEDKRHPTAIGRPKTTAPIKQHIDDHQGKTGDILYHGAGQDQVSADALKGIANQVDVYDPFQDPSDSKDVWKRDIRTRPTKQYDQVHSHYTLNVVKKNGPKQGKDVMQEIHDNLKDTGTAVISVRRDDICAPKAKPKLTDPIQKSLPKREWVQRLVKAAGQKLKPAPKVEKPKEQGMVTSIKPKTGKLAVEAEKQLMAGGSGGMQPYGRRFPMVMSARGSFSGVDKIKSEPVAGGLWHHYGQIDENNTMHTISKEKNPSLSPLAGIITGKKDNKNYVRAAMANVMMDEPLSILKSKMMLNPNHMFQEPIELDAQKHAEEGWEGHHPHLIHGLIPDKTLQVPPNSVTDWLSFAGVKGDETPRVIAKEALSTWDKYSEDEQKEHSYFGHPTFNTAHREAAYSKLAHEVFGLGEYVPKTTVFRHPLSNKTWSAAEFIPGLKPMKDSTKHQDLKQVTDNGDIYKMAIMNAVLGNNDRHGNNLFKDAAGKIHLVDHGLSFDYNHITTDVLPWYIHNEHDEQSTKLDDKVPESVHQWIGNLDPMELQQKLLDSGAPHDVADMAVKRLVDVKSWSGAQHFGSALYHEGMHRGLRYLMDVLVGNQFNTSEADKKENAIKAMDRMQRGHKPIVGATQPNMGKETEIVDKPHAVIDPNTGEYSVEHPANEISQRHPNDKEGNQGRDGKRNKP